MRAEKGLIRDLDQEAHEPDLAVQYELQKREYQEVHQKAVEALDIANSNEAHFNEAKRLCEEATEKMLKMLDTKQKMYWAEPSTKDLGEIG